MPDYTKLPPSPKATKTEIKPKHQTPNTVISEAGVCLMSDNRGPLLQGYALGSPKWRKNPFMNTRF